MTRSKRLPRIKMHAKSPYKRIPRQQTVKSVAP
jgi:hypothetical protein